MRESSCRRSEPRAAAPSLGTAGHLDPLEQTIFGAVLAGGLSERMGQPKALMPWPGPGGNLVLTAAGVLGAVAQEVAVVVAPGQDLGLGEAASLVRDALPADGGIDGARGPLAGITAALESAHARGHGLLALLPCDMPLVTPAEFHVLRAEIDRGADVALFEVDGVDQPLCAVYRSHLHRVARAAFDRGSRRPAAVLRGCDDQGHPIRVTRVGSSEFSRVRLVNVNTPSDYDTARKTLHEPQGRPT